jgi:hypothetical protein
MAYTLACVVNIIGSQQCVLFVSTIQPSLKRASYDYKVYVLCYGVHRDTTAAVCRRVVSVLRTLARAHFYEILNVYCNFYNKSFITNTVIDGNIVIQRSLSPQHGASSGCGQNTAFRYTG